VNIIFLVLMASLFSLKAMAGFTPFFCPNGGFLNKLTEMIHGPSAKTIDISIYSFGSSLTNPVLVALADVKKSRPEVEIRLILDKGNAKAKPKTVAFLEENGIDVRTVSKINHHKFIVINAPRCSGSTTCEFDPGQTKILAGSANFNENADQKQDEAATFMENEPLVAIQYDHAFSHAWNHSSDLGTPILPAKLPANNEGDSASPVLFTHDNFSVAGTTFKPNGETVVSDTVVQLIKNAKHSIKLAQTHFRLKNVAMALLEKSKDPSVSIMIYLDGQNFVSFKEMKEQQATLQACASNENCGETGIDWAWPLLFSPEDLSPRAEQNILIRYKFTGSKNDKAPPPQMHSKYLIIDDSILLTGSYNYSLNSELGSFEDVILFDATSSSDHAAMVDAFNKNFQYLWERNRDKIQEATTRLREGRSLYDLPVSLDGKEISQIWRTARSN
jgi:phosphatidylserine/phosphatidylglycerophosphate/cardiolipin synthase-like enzyme